MRRGVYSGSTDGVRSYLNRPLVELPEAARESGVSAHGEAEEGGVTYLANMASLPVSASRTAVSRS